MGLTERCDTIFSGNWKPDTGNRSRPVARLSVSLRVSPHNTTVLTLHYFVVHGVDNYHLQPPHPTAPPPTPFADPSLRYSLLAAGMLRNKQAITKPFTPHPPPPVHFHQNPSPIPTITPTSPVTPQWHSPVRADPSL